MLTTTDDASRAKALELDWSRSDDLGQIARLNDVAFGFPPPAFEAVCRRWPTEHGWSGYVARVSGKVVSGLLSWLSPDEDCAITAVATLPEARGLDLASKLLGSALAEARELGARTTTLQATSKGRAVYERLGYVDLGAMGMWERRTPAPSAT